jgi:hypothetical protein
MGCRKESDGEDDDDPIDETMLGSGLPLVVSNIR